MNGKLSKETKVLINLVKETEAYVDYLNYKSFLDEQPELKDKVDSFRRKGFEIQMGHKYGYFDAYENLLHLNGENIELLNEPVVKSFLEAELKVSKMFSEILNMFVTEIEFDIDFFDN